MKKTINQVRKKHRFNKKCRCFDCDVRYGPGQKKLVQKITKKLEEEVSHRGPLWNWLHDDLRKDEMKKPKKVHRHRYDRAESGRLEDWNYKNRCKCGKRKP